MYAYFIPNTLTCKNRMIVCFYNGTISTVPVAAFPTIQSQGIYWLDIQPICCSCMFNRGWKKFRRCKNNTRGFIEHYPVAIYGRSEIWINRRMVELARRKYQTEHFLNWVHSSWPRSDEIGSSYNRNPTVKPGIVNTLHRIELESKKKNIQ